MPSPALVKLLIASEIFPFPPENGGAICVYSFLEYLQERYELHLLLAVDSLQKRSQLELYRSKLPTTTIHVVDAYHPIKLSQRVRWRIRALLSSVLRFGRSAGPLQRAELYYATSFPPHSRQYIECFTSLLAKHRFDIVQLEYTPMLPLVSLIPAGTKKVFIEHESRHLVIRDAAEVERLSPPYKDYLRETIKAMELAFMQKFDAIFCLNSTDTANLQSELSKVKIFTSPFPILESDLDPSPPARGKAERIVLMGGESHYPNVDALEWFVAEILPLIGNQSIPIKVLGAWSRKTRARFEARTSRLEFVGFIDDLRPILNKSISIVPIRVGGGGLRTKSIYAMANHSAVVSTSLGAIGIHDITGEAMAVADTTVDFAQAINRLLSDPDAFYKAVCHGKEQVLAHFRQRILCERRNSYYQQILNER